MSDMDFEDLRQLAKDNPVEYIRQAFENKTGEWYRGVLLTSETVKDALEDYLSTFSIRETPLNIKLYAYFF
jgi:hypothetical protein